MLRSAASKVMLVGRATVFMVGLAVILALVLGVAATALAGTGVGATFNLGRTNTVDAVSRLVGSTAGSMLVVDNNGAGTALDLRVGQGTDPTTKTVAPMKVDSQAVVTNLNADKVDGQDASAFASTTHGHAGEDITSGTVAEARIDATVARDGEVVPTVEANDGSGSGLDADLLDGRDSSDFQPSNPCPSGTLFHEGACIETTKRSGTSNFLNAEGTCLQAGRRLPTVAELQTFRLRQGHDFNTAEYTSHIWSDTNGATQNHMVVRVEPATGTQRAVSYSEGAAFRCVADPNDAWESEARNDLRNAVTAATACAADNGGSYANCGSLALLKAYGFNKSTDVSYLNVMATVTRWVSRTQHVDGGSAFEYDTATGEIEPVPRF